MPRGGARNRSGPPPDPNSGRSDRRGLKLDVLPASGYDGDPPHFLLPDPTPRERELWAWAWRTPQACAWREEKWRWQAVSMWVRLSASCEQSDATAAMLTALHRFADQIGLTPAGLKENGWKIADEAAPATRVAVDAVEEDADDPRARLTLVRDAAG